MLNLPANLYKVNQTKRLEEIDALRDLSSQDTCSFASSLGLDNDTNQLSTHPRSSTHDSIKTESRQDNSVYKSDYKVEDSHINKIDFIDEKQSSHSRLKVRSPTISKISRGKTDLEGMTKSLSDADIGRGQAGGHASNIKEATTSSHGYYSNSSPSAANSSAVMHGAVVRRKVERSPADRLLRSVDFDAIERLTSQEDKQQANPNLARVTVREKRLSLLCFQWRKRYKSVFYNDDESTEYRPATKSKEDKQ